MTKAKITAYSLADEKNVFLVIETETGKEIARNYHSFAWLSRFMSNYQFDDSEYFEFMDFAMKNLA